MKSFKEFIGVNSSTLKSLLIINYKFNFRFIRTCRLK
jgi:hypothetical protein